MMTGEMSFGWTHFHLSSIAFVALIGELCRSFVELCGALSVDIIDGNYRSRLLKSREQWDVGRDVQNIHDHRNLSTNKTTLCVFYNCSEMIVHAFRRARL